WQRSPRAAASFGRSRPRRRPTNASCWRCAVCSPPSRWVRCCPRTAPRCSACAARWSARIARGRSSGSDPALTAPARTSLTSDEGRRARLGRVFGEADAASPIGRAVLYQAWVRASGQDFRVDVAEARDPLGRAALTSHPSVPARLGDLTHAHFLAAREVEEALVGATAQVRVEHLTHLPRQRAVRILSARQLRTRRAAACRGMRGLDDATAHFPFRIDLERLWVAPAPRRDLQTLDERIDRGEIAVRGVLGVVEHLRTDRGHDGVVSERLEHRELAQAGVRLVQKLRCAVGAARTLAERVFGRLREARRVALASPASDRRSLAISALEQLEDASVLQVAAVRIERLVAVDGILPWRR